MLVSAWVFGQVQTTSVRLQWALHFRYCRRSVAVLKAPVLSLHQNQTAQEYQPHLAGWSVTARSSVEAKELLKR
jgi:hypothetical protein